MSEEANKSLVDYFEKYDKHQKAVGQEVSIETLPVQLQLDRHERLLSDILDSIDELLRKIIEIED